MARPENSVQLYSVRNQLERDFDLTLTRLAEMGFRSVEPFSLPANISKLKTSLANAGLKAPTAHGDVVINPRGAIDAALELGSSVLIDPYQPEEIFQSESELQRLADQLSAAAELAAPHGIKIGYHNHDHELRNEVRGVPALFALANMVSQDVVFEIDLFWCQVANVDPIDVLKELDGRVVALHAKDAPMGGHVKDQVSVGKGSVDVLACANQAPSARLVVEFDEYNGDIFEGVAGSLNYLKENGFN
jgi:sugar phosphate isomerase/epimerase